MCVKTIAEPKSSVSRTRYTYTFLLFFFAGYLQTREDNRVNTQDLQWMVKVDLKMM